MRSEPETIILSEVDWNEQSPKEVEEKGLDASPFAKYRTSKALAEKGTEVFLDEVHTLMPTRSGLGFL